MNIRNIFEKFIFRKELSSFVSALEIEKERVQQSYCEEYNASQAFCLLSNAVESAIKDHSSYIAKQIKGGMPARILVLALIKNACELQIIEKTMNADNSENNEVRTSLHALWEYAMTELRVAGEIDPQIYNDQMKCMGISVNRSRLLANLD